MENNPRQLKVREIREFMSGLDNLEVEPLFVLAGFENMPTALFCASAGIEPGKIGDLDYPVLKEMLQKVQEANADFLADLEGLMDKVDKSLDLPSSSGESTEPAVSS